MQSIRHNQAGKEDLPPEDNASLECLDVSCSQPKVGQHGTYLDWHIWIEFGFYRGRPNPEHLFPKPIAPSSSINEFEPPLDRSPFKRKSLRSPSV